jgi:curved DNA-binding protein CbpA
VPTPPAADAQHEPLLLQWDDGETGRPATPVGAEELAGTAGDGAAEGMVAASAAAPAAPAGWEASSAEVAGPEGPAALAASPPAEGAEATPAPFAGAGGPAAADAAEMERDAVVDGPRAAGAEGIPLASPSTAHEEPAGGEAQPEGEAAGPGETAEAPAAAVRVERLEPEPAREPEGEGEAAGTRDSPAPVLEPAVAEARREVLAFFESLASKSHFEVLGVEPGCTDADVKRAYAALARKYHPDLHHRNGLEDLHDVLEGIFIRVGEAWEVLGDARSRRSYEARLAPRSPAAEDAAAATAEAEAEPYVPGEETVHAAQLLLSQARYWDAIQMLEARLPQMPPSRQQRRGRILLARAYAKNPNWLRRAEEALQQVVREDPANADAHYELGLLYKAGGMQARAQASFRRTLDLQPDHRHAAAELGGKRGAAPASSPTAGGLLKRLFGGRGKAS